ncbi:hypothetical protein EIP91_011200 [Steccherinum ochraceum]|uniref:Uncharacterized protein n=1 Tax=Steccherinum ochraceum TaxID=92696 RepID=A0A4V2MUU1_9APHY|nr:hypothetical protein EIP91_011200 [Steccherinum ochraceum]
MAQYTAAEWLLREALCKNSAFACVRYEFLADGPTEHECVFLLQTGSFGGGGLGLTLPVPSNPEEPKEACEVRDALKSLGLTFEPYNAYTCEYE